jgi:hypothetical protein
MKSAGALLLDLSGSNTLSSKLQKILETAFTITLPPHFSRIDEELAQTIRRVDAGLIFLISVPATLAATCDVLAALKTVVPDVPVIHGSNSFANSSGRVRSSCNRRKRSL